jgi:hypothetical protein
MPLGRLCSEINYMPWFLYLHQLKLPLSVITIVVSIIGPFLVVYLLLWLGHGISVLATAVPSY